MPTTAETTAEFARLALPLMTRHGIPVTPRNYAVWYEYVAGSPDMETSVSAGVMVSCKRGLP